MATDIDDLELKDLTVTGASPDAPKHRPGEIHSWVFDQMEVWIDAKGNEHQILEMSIEEVRDAIAVLMNEAAKFRVAWSMEQKQTFDPTESARRWFTGKPIMLAFMARLVMEAVEQSKAADEARQFSWANPTRWLTR